MQSHIKTTRLKLALVSAFAMAAVAASAPSYSSTATGTASATVIRPITITKVNDLSFGTFAPDTAASSVTIATDGSRTKTGSAFLVPSAVGGAGRFNVSGQTSTTYAITYAPLTTVTSGVSDSMNISLFSEAAPSATTSGTLLPTGTLSSADPGIQSLYIGGTLTVAANQVPGTYSGAVGITVDYN
jgi:hypothetical protein